MERRLFAFLVVAGFLYISYPLIFPIAMGGVLAALFSPWADQLQRRKISNRLASGSLTLAITLVLILPSSLLISFLARAGFRQIQTWKATPGGTGVGFLESLMNLPKVQKFLYTLTQFLPLNMDDLLKTMEQVATAVGSKVAELLGAFLGQIPGILLALALVVVSVYFFLVDRHQILEWVRENSFFDKKETEYLIRSLGEMCRSVIVAAIVSGAAQALVEGIAVAVVGMPNVLLIVSLVFLGSFVPLVGSSPVTLVVALEALIEGNQAASIGLLVVAVIVAGIDNTVRPLVLKGGARLHPLLGFVAALGGLGALGFFGIFLGPILAGLLVATIQILARSKKVKTT